MTVPYDKPFYADRQQATRHAAERLLALVVEHISFARVADVGCGTGTWLAAALRLGADEAFGYEGDWVDGTQLDDDRIMLTAVDLEHSLTGAKVDLAISLEVAEHLSEARAESFIDDLCAMSPAILFGAAIPGQGGVNHINEQWQSYWALKFASRGFDAFDVIRPCIWSDDAIPPWYRQNPILFLAETMERPAGLKPVSELGTLDIVHPAFWERANRELRYANALPESEYLKLGRSGI